jgi:hypothetical protein
VGLLWVWQFSKLVIEHGLSSVDSSKTIGFFEAQFHVNIQALDNTIGKLRFGDEPVENQLEMLSELASDAFERLDHHRITWVHQSSINRLAQVGNWYCHSASKACTFRYARFSGRSAAHRLIAASVFSLTWFCV